MKPPKKEPDYIANLPWKSKDRFLIEKEMVRKGGRIKVAGKVYGKGSAHHYQAAAAALFPDVVWHKWAELLFPTFVNQTETGIIGPASSGKTYTSAMFALTTLMIWPKGTSIICSSTTRKGLQLRIWGAIKELFAQARKYRPWLPGTVLDSQDMLTTESEKPPEGRDYRDGIIGVACKVGGTFVGLSNYVGLKNERVVVIADEASLMGRGFLDALPNLRKNPVFKLIAMGNPKDRTDALGVVCEPDAKTGGWDGLPEEHKTRTWRTRNGGMGVQICGYDSPNYDHPRGKNPFPYLITPEQIDRDLAYYGRDSLQFSMMNLGVMPKDGGNRRVITMALCERKLAFERAVWESSDKLTRCVGVDPAYSGVGGDRCPLVELVWGPDSTGVVRLAVENYEIIPIVTGQGEPEDQIALHLKNYCVTKGIPPECAGFDSTGKGTVGTAIARIWSGGAYVHPIYFGGPPTDRQASMADPRPESEVYDKFVSALWFASRHIIDGGQMRQLPREFAEEGSMREWGINRNGKQDVEPKEITKERMGKSPDLWDGLVVAIEVARRNGFNIASGIAMNVNRGMPKAIKDRYEKFRKVQQNSQLVFTQ